MPLASRLKRPTGESLNTLDMLDLMQQEGGSAQMNSAVGAVREGFAGPDANPAYSDLDQGQLSQLDRFSQGAKFAEGNSGLGGLLKLAGIVPAAAGFAGNELTKVIPGGQALMGKLSGDTTGQFDTSAATSKPSLSNVTAGLKGYVAGANPELARAILSYFQPENEQQRNMAKEAHGSGAASLLRGLFKR